MATSPRMGWPHPNENLKLLYERGLSIAAVAEEVGSSASTVQRKLQALGVSCRSQEEAHPHKFSRDEAASLYQQGLSASDVAELLGVSKQPILLHLRRAGLVRKVNDSWVDRATSLYLGGQTLPEIAPTLGVSVASVYRRLVASGVALRPRSFYSSLRVGVKNPNWRHGDWCGKSKPYPKEFNPELKARIRERDGYVCRLCGMTESVHRRKFKSHRDSGPSLTVHHVDYDKDNCSETNLVALCFVCNPRVNKNRDKWQAVFKTQLEAFYG